MLIHSAEITGSVQLNNTDVSGITNVAGFATTASVDSLVVKTGSYATTGSNQFNGNQSISGSIVSNGTITAQTLVVQTVTSSIEFVTGSTRNGSLSSNTHQFTGSVSITGSATSLLSVNNNVLFVSASGNVGIGTVTPRNKLDVNGVIYSSGYWTTDDSIGGGFYIGDLNTGASYTYFGGDGSTSANSYLYFATNGTTRMVINNSGSVGIGTSSPTQKLHVVGSTGLPASSGTLQSGSLRLQVSGYGTVLDFGAEGPSTGKQWIQATDSSSLAIQYPLLLNPRGGYVGIGTTNTPGTALQVNGGVSSNSGVTSAAHDTWTTVYTFTNTDTTSGMFQFFVGGTNSSLICFWTKSWNGGASQLVVGGSVASNGLCSVQASGDNIQVKQTYGVSLNIYWSLQKIF